VLFELRIFRINVHKKMVVVLYTAFWSDLLASSCNWYAYKVLDKF
jgi:hypothetical protein